MAQCCVAHVLGRALLLAVLLVQLPASADSSAAESELNEATGQALNGPAVADFPLDPPSRTTPGGCAQGVTVRLPSRGGYLCSAPCSGGCPTGMRCILRVRVDDDILPYCAAGCSHHSECPSGALCMQMGRARFCAWQYIATQSVPGSETLPAFGNETVLVSVNETLSDGQGHNRRLLRAGAGGETFV